MIYARFSRIRFVILNSIIDIGFLFDFGKFKADFTSNTLGLYGEADEIPHQANYWEENH